MELRLRRYDSIVDIFMYSESLFIGHVFECSTRQQGSSGLYWGKNYFLYFLFLRILLICLKYAKLKCMEADYRGFPVLVTIEYHWELREKNAISNHQICFFWSAYFVTKFNNILSPGLTRI